MLECPSCHRLHPEVEGAPTQICPHCEHEYSLVAAADGSHLPRADPVGALQTALRLGARDYPVFLLLWLPALVLDLAAGFATLAYSTARGLPSDLSGITTGEQMELLGIALPLYLIAFTVRLAGWTFVSARVMDRIDGGRRLRNWRALLVPALVGGAVLLVTYIAGSFLFVVGFFVMLHWFLYVPAHLADGKKGVAAAFEASRKFARERRTHGFTALVVLWGALAWAIYFALNVLPENLAILAPALFAWLAGPVVPILAASFVAISRMPAPDAATSIVASLKEVPTSSTACPRCEALIDYTPTGSPVEIVCPACGHTGRVL